MRIADHDIEALKGLGYTEDEAQFLYIVATHSGYFVARQFIRFTGVSWGKRSTHFAEKLQSQGHATWREYEGTGRVFHLFSRNLYGEIGKENLRNRRRHSLEFIKTRLVTLDFILANQGYDYLETEQQKVSYFCDHLQVPKQCLPTKVYEGSSRTQLTLRYFVDKFPLFLAPLNPSFAPVITLSYVDPGLASVQGFANHLHAYLPLLRYVGDFRFLYISNSSAHFSKAEECFSSLVKAPLETDVSSELVRYFRLRKAWDRKQYGTVSNEDLEWLNDSTRRFHGERFEKLYRAWNSGELSEDGLRREFQQTHPHRKAVFGTYLVKGSRCEFQGRHAEG